MIAIIPARGNSKRFPRKNIALLNGKPLIHYTIQAAINSKVFSKIFLTSEDEEILNIAKQYPIEVLKRNYELSRDNTTVWQVCMSVLLKQERKGINPTSFSVLLPTSPLRISDDIKGAYRLFTESGADCLMSVIPYNYPPQHALKISSDGFIKNVSNELFTQSQNLEKMYRHDGSIIMIKSDIFKVMKEFYVSKIIPYYMPSKRAVDIDTPLDLAWAKFILGRDKCDN